MTESNDLHVTGDIVRLPSLDATLSLHGTSLWCAAADADLDAEALFARSYLPHRVPLAFRDGYGVVSAVSAFGLRPQDDSRFGDLRRQVSVLWQEGSPFDGDLRVAVDLGAGAPVEVVVGLIEHPRSLRSAWDEVLTRAASPRPLDSREVLLVPEVRGRTTDGTHIRIGPYGEPASSAMIPIVGGPRTLSFGRPFFLCARRRTEAQPFLAMWVDDDAVLRPFDVARLPEEPAPPGVDDLVAVGERAARKVLHAQGGAYVAYFVPDSGAYWREHLTLEELRHGDLYLVCEGVDATDVGARAADVARVDETSWEISPAGESPGAVRPVDASVAGFDVPVRAAVLRIELEAEARQRLLRRGSLALTWNGPPPTKLTLVAVRHSPRSVPALSSRYVHHPQVTRRDDDMHLVSFSWGKRSLDSITSADLREDAILVEVTGEVTAELRASLPGALAVASWDEIAAVLSSASTGVDAIVASAAELPGYEPVPGAVLLRLDKRSSAWPAIVSSGTLAMYLRGLTSAMHLGLIAHKVA